jgi:hypothetical protein
MAEYEEAVNPIPFVGRSQEDRMKAATEQLAGMAKRMRPDQTMTLRRHEEGEHADGRLFTATIRPWP